MASAEMAVHPSDPASLHDRTDVDRLLAGYRSGRAQQTLFDLRPPMLQGPVVGYDEFLERVATGRKKTRDEVDAIAQGRVWAGADARRLGLVDQLGSFNDATRAAARRAKVSDYALEFIEPELTWAQALAMQLRSGPAALMQRASPTETALAQLAQRLDPVTREAQRLARFTAPNRLYAYCFCEVR